MERGKLRRSGLGWAGRLAGVAALAVALAAIIVSAYAAADGRPTRPDYVVQLEVVCKPRAEATRRAMRGARADIKAERLAIAARKFGQAARIFGTTVQIIGRVPRPAADRSRLRKWFRYLRMQESYLERIAAQLRARHSIRAQRLTARFIHNGNLANNVTLAFSFDYCSFRFSRYG